MQYIIDHLAAVVIGASIILIVTALQFRTQEVAVDGAQYLAAKSRTVEWARLVDFDFANIGSGLTNAQIAAGEALLDTAFSANGDAFTFRAVSDSVSGASVNVICYVRQDTGTTVQVLDPATNTYVNRPTFRIVRRVNPSYSGTCAGGSVEGRSAETLTQFRIVVGDVAGFAPSTLAEARRIAVTMRAVSPLGGGTTAAQGGMASYIDQTRWDKVYRPINLARPAP